MLKNIKYLELTRHHMFVKTKKMMDNSSKREDDSFNKLSEVVFSSALSIFLTYLTENYIASKSGSANSISKLIIGFLIAISIYILLFLIIKYFYARIYNAYLDIKYKKQCNSPETSAEKNKEFIDDFDHIAFDNLIISYELISQINTNENVYVRNFYFHEAVYYLRTAINKTLDITHPDRRESCLNIFGNVNGVDVFRLLNAYKMMHDLEQEISKILNNGILRIDDEIKIDSEVDENEVEDALKFQIEEISKDISRINKACIQALNELAPKN